MEIRHSMVSVRKVKKNYILSLYRTETVAAFSKSRHYWAGRNKMTAKDPCEVTAGWPTWRAAISWWGFFSVFDDEHSINYLQKGYLNLPQHPVFIHTLPCSSLSVPKEFWDTRFNGFRVMGDIHMHTLSFLFLQILWSPSLLCSSSSSPPPFSFVMKLLLWWEPACGQSAMGLRSA